MTKSKTSTAAGELINMYLRLSENHDMEPDKELLKKNNMSTDQWDCFVQLIEDLDLNETGVKILLEEVKSGRVVLPCNK